MIIFGGGGQENLIGYKLIIDVVTRWNSILYMLQRLNEQYPVLMTLAHEPTLSKTSQFWTSTIKISFAFVFIPSTVSHARRHFIKCYSRWYTLYEHPTTQNESTAGENRLRLDSRFGGNQRVLKTCTVKKTIRINKTWCEYYIEKHMSSDGIDYDKLESIIGSHHHERRLIDYRR